MAAHGAVEAVILARRRHGLREPKVLANGALALSWLARC
eukprot:COSAG06_NODE_4052_length_4625_cov_21.008396_2_plen_39_part_00